MSKNLLLGLALLAAFICFSAAFILSGRRMEDAKPKRFDTVDLEGSTWISLALVTDKVTKREYLASSRGGFIEVTPDEVCP